MNELGPVVLNVGSMRQTTIGRWTFGTSIALGIIGLVFTAVSLVVMILGLAFADLVVVGVIGVFLVGAGVLIVLFAILMCLQVSGTTAQLHANGLALGQSWFRKAQIPWAQVVRIEPPTRSSTLIRCDVVLQSGARICADRLRLKPVVGSTGHYVNHPDVQTVLDHFAAWQRAHGGQRQH